VQRTGHAVTVGQQLAPVPLGVGQERVPGLCRCGCRVFSEDTHVTQGTQGE